MGATGSPSTRPRPVRRRAMARADRMLLVVEASPPERAEDLLVEEPSGPTPLKIVGAMQLPPVSRMRCRRSPAPHLAPGGFHMLQVRAQLVAAGDCADLIRATAGRRRAAFRDRRHLGDEAVVNNTVARGAGSGHADLTEFLNIPNAATLAAWSRSGASAKTTFLATAASSRWTRSRLDRPAYSRSPPPICARPAKAMTSTSGCSHRLSGHGAPAGDDVQHAVKESPLRSPVPPDEAGSATQPRTASPPPSFPSPARPRFSTRRSSAENSRGR